MKRPSLLSSQFVRSTLLVSVLCLFGGKSLAQDFRTVHPGVEYAQAAHRLGNDPVKINLIRLDLSKVRLDVHHAFDQAIGTETTSSIAKRKGAIAAINAGFFRLDKSEFAGDAVGTLMIDGELLSESLNRRATLVAVNQAKQTNILIGHFSTSIAFGFERGRDLISISGINRERKNGEIILYDSRFGKISRSSLAAVELVFSECEKPRSRLEMRAAVCREVEVVRNGARRAIPERGFIVSIDPAAVEGLATAERELGLRALRRKGRPFIRFLFRDELTGLVLAADDNTDIVGGIPQLIKDSHIDITWQEEKAGRSFVEARHPRTAVAKLKDGKFLMITVDGRQPGVSVGMNLHELAEYLLSLGATDAMNLDGGGSTTMFLDGKVVNTPSDREGERKVSDAIVVTLRKNARR